MRQVVARRRIKVRGGSLGPFLCWAVIFADIGTLGEGSIALADNLGIWSNAREGGRRGGILYLIFPGTGNGQPRTVEEINEQGEKTFQGWGGTEQINSCAVN